MSGPWRWLAGLGIGRSAGLGSGNPRDHAANVCTQRQHRPGGGSQKCPQQTRSSASFLVFLLLFGARADQLRGEAAVIEDVVVRFEAGTLWWSGGGRSEWRHRIQAGSIVDGLAGRCGDHPPIALQPADQFRGGPKLARLRPQGDYCQSTLWRIRYLSARCRVSCL